jgi:hypothetical protein
MISQQAEEPSEESVQDGDAESDQPLTETLNVPDPIPRSFSPWSDMSSSDSEFEEESKMPPENSISLLASSKTEVEKILDHLARLAVAIRKSGANSRARKADRLFNPIDHNELRDHLTLIILARGGEESADHYTIDPSSLSPVQERLILANLRRRNRFVYAQRHARKLAFNAPSHESKFVFSGTDRFSFLLESDDVGQRRNHPEAMGQAIPGGVDITPAPRHHPLLTATSASAAGTQIQPLTQKITTPSQVAKTNITSTAAKVVYPRPPRLRDGLRYFQCPCCCQTLPEMFQQDTLWKQVNHLVLGSLVQFRGCDTNTPHRKHLMEDVCPYTCIIQDCSEEKTLYVTRNEWRKHVQKDHQKCWECLPCTTPGQVPVIFSSVEGFLSHNQREPVFNTNARCSAARSARD